MAEQAVIWKAEADTLLDVRPELESGGEPFVHIMEAVASIKPGGTLVIIALFEPVPLYDVLGERGFSHETARIAADEWAQVEAQVPHQIVALTQAVLLVTHSGRF